MVGYMNIWTFSTNFIYYLTRVRFWKYITLPLNSVKAANTCMTSNPVDKIFYRIQIHCFHHLALLKTFTTFATEKPAGFRSFSYSPKAVR